MAIHQQLNRILILQRRYLVKKETKNFNPLVISLVLNIIFLALALIFCDPKYETSDDYMVDALLSGAFGDSYNPFMLFSNFILGYLLVALYHIIPIGSMYFCILIAIAFFGFVTISYLLIKKNPTIIGVFLSFIIISFYSDDLYISINFTKTATIAIIAGGLLIAEAFHTVTKLNVLQLVIGGLQLIFGSFLRFDCLPLCVSFILLYIVLSHKTYNKKSLFKLIVFGILLFALSYGLFQLNTLIRIKNPKETAYFENNAVNLSIRDTINPEYAYQKELYNSLGYSETDYNMLSDWNFMDKDIFTVQNRKVIGEFRTNTWKYYAKNVIYCLEGLGTRAKEFYLYPSTWCICLLLLLQLWMSSKKTLKLFLFPILSFVLLYYCIYKGRLNYRVSYSIFLCCGVCISMLLNRNKIKSPKFYIGLIGLLFLCKIPLYIPDTTYKTATDEDYYTYAQDAMYHGDVISYKRYKIDLSHRQTMGELIERIENDTENYYLISFLPYIQTLYYNYKPWERIEMGYLKDNYTYLGGVTFDNGYCEESFIANGINADNPNKSLLENNNLIFVTLDPTMETQYLKEHYNTSIDPEIIDTCFYGYLLKYTVHEN